MEELNLEQLRTTLPHEEFRGIFEWGTYGKNGDEPLRYIKLKDISDNHLDNIINHLTLTDGDGLGVGRTLNLMHIERGYRLVNGVSVPEYPIVNSFKFFQ